MVSSHAEGAAAASQPGLTYSRQARSDIAVRVDAAQAPTAVARELASAPAVQEAVLAAIRTAAGGETVATFLETLEAAGVDALDGELRALAVRVAQGDERAAWDLLRTLRGLGRDVGQTGREAALSTLPALLGLAESVTPTVAVRVEPAFFDRRREQRVAVCRLVASLADAVPVVLEAGPIEQRRLAETHRETLPGVGERCNTPGPQTPREERVRQALADLSPDGRPLAILDALADEESRTLRYSALYSRFQVAPSTLRGVVSDLADRGLVERFDAGPNGKRAVELRQAGETVVEQIPRQRSLEGCVDETGKSPTDSRVQRAQEVGGEDRPAEEAVAAGTTADRHRMSEEVVGVATLSRAHHVAAAASAPEHGIGLVDEAVALQEDRREPAWHYDEARDELAVGVEADNPLTLTVGLARALASKRTFDEVLDEARLEGLDLGTELVRGARCIGWWPEDVADDPAAIRDQFLEAHRDLLELLTRLSKGDYDDEARFRGEIVRFAHGLAGSMAHLFDLAGVDVVRQVKLPRCRTMARSTRAALGETLAVLTAIQSRYGHFAAYRQLFEQRGDKRKAAPSPTVDAADPVGRFIGSLTVVGPGVPRLFGPHLEGHLRSPRPLVEDAPEFVLDVPVDARATEDRRRYAAAVARSLEHKHLRPTRTAVGIFQAFASSPYSAAAAVVRGLDPEGERREIRLDEARTALATLEADQLLPEHPPTVADVILALLRTDAPLDRATLADHAGRSVRSLRSHLEELETLGLVVDTDAGLRLALPRTEERHGDATAVLPWWAAGTNDGRRATLEGVVAAVLDEAVGDRERHRAAHRALAGETDLAPALEAVPWLARWLLVVEALEADGPPPDALPAPPTLRLGEPPEQTPLADASRAVAAD